MTRPGTSVTLRDTPSVASLSTDTGTAFFAGLTDRGPLRATLIQSLSALVTAFGDRQSYSPLYDTVELFFREGGNRVYIGRAVGPGATSGTLNLLDASSAVSLVATANGPGAWSADYKVAVVAGVGAGTFKIQVTDSGGNVLEDSGDLATQDAAVHWSQSSNYIRLTLGASSDNPDLVAATALSAGDDDRANITDTQWQAALDLFTPDLGPGQVAAPGRTTDTAHTQLKNHAEANNRVALLDLTDTATVATLEAAAAAVTSRFAAAFAPWIVIPGLTTGTTRTVPPSGLLAGLVARNDPALGPNHPAAGKSGISRYAIGLSQTSLESSLTALSQNGVNLVRNILGSVRVYGWRSLCDYVNDADWIDFGNARLFTAIASGLDNVGEEYAFEEIDGQNGQTINGFHDALAGELLKWYNQRQLFGDTADQAFSVDTGPDVNTLTTIAANELHAVCSVHMAPFAEWVSIEIVKTAVTQSL